MSKRDDQNAEIYESRADFPSAWRKFLPTGLPSAWWFKPSNFFLRKYTVSGSVAWTLQFGLDTADVPGGLVVSGSYVYLVGAYRGVGRVVYKFNLASGGTWFKTQFAGSSRHNATGIAADSSGNLYAAGSTEVPCGFEGYDDCSDVLIVKLNPLGKRLWSKQINLPGMDGIAQSNAVGSLPRTQTTSISLRARSTCLTAIASRGS